MVCSAAITDCEEDDHGVVLIKFVHALAKRQARLDVLAFNAASETAEEFTLKRAFIYSRYSTDLQNEKSVEDQIELCKTHARKLGLSVVGCEHDRAKSGASTFGRPGLGRILEAAKTGDFEVLLSGSPRPNITRYG